MGDYLTEGMGMMSLRMGIENREWNSAFAAHTHSLTPSGHQLTPSAINATSQSARLSLLLTVSTFSLFHSLFLPFFPVLFALSIVTSVCAVLDQPLLLLPFSLILFDFSYCTAAAAAAVKNDLNVSN